jgi:hypothetical protein
MREREQSVKLLLWRRRDMYMQARPAREARGERIEKAALLHCDAWIPDPIVAVVARDATSFDYTPRALTQQAA